MPRSALGPWWKFYVTLPRDKAHYTDRQFRAFVTVISLAEEHPPLGELPKLKALRALLGADEIDFLVTEGDVTVTRDGTVTVTHRHTYQSPGDPTAADRQKRKRERDRGEKQVSQQVDNDVENRDDDVTVTRDSGRDALPLHSASVETTKENGTAEAARDDDGPDWDSLDTYERLTGSRPWGRPSGRWLHELEDRHGIAQVDTALTEEHRRDAHPETLIKRVAVRLAKSLDAAERSGQNGAYRPPELFSAEHLAKVDSDATREAAAALRASVAGMDLPRRQAKRGLTKLGDLLPSEPSDAAPQGAILNEAEVSNNPMGPEGVAARRHNPEATQGQGSSGPGVEANPSLRRPTVRDRERPITEAPMQASGSPAGEEGER